MKIDIDDGLYDRIKKIAQARLCLSTAEREIEKAVALYLAKWEWFFFGIASTEIEAIVTGGDTA